MSPPTIRISAASAAVPHACAPIYPSPPNLSFLAVGSTSASIRVTRSSCISTGIRPPVGYRHSSPPTPSSSSRAPTSGSTTTPASSLTITSFPFGKRRRQMSSTSCAMSAVQSTMPFYGVLRPPPSSLPTATSKRTRASATGARCSIAMLNALPIPHSYRTGRERERRAATIERAGMTQHLSQSARRSETTQVVSGGSPGKGRLWRRGHGLESIGRRWVLASVKASRLRSCASWQAWKGDWQLA